ncbi:putative butyrate kinase [Enterococcus florum]|uniref:Probable butyrate kinase n=1 Tax=Enterococcus florum TaxID=2480627 RepID=A0A4P5PBI6_9ENTE|nr:butyrate kinase [Enterococcus florum]GCF95555.1 putative butyrate kinase [Enterococcus florum]
MKILAINPGSTSTKVSYYNDGSIVEEQSISHATEDLQHFQRTIDQIDFRRDIILSFMEEKGISPQELDAVVGRGGILPPVSSGAFEVNESMIHYLKHVTTIDHPSNLGAILAHEIKENGNEQTIALIYDPVSVDEFDDVARVSGLKGIERKSIGHALNMRAVAMKVAREAGIPYNEATLIVAHLGGGNSISIHHKGRMIDSISDDEGPFSTERTGGLPLKYIMPLCYEHSLKDMMRIYKREGGLKSYAGTSDAREIESRIEAGDEELRVVYEAFIYQIAKGIGELSTVACGQVDRIALTGGVAHSKAVVSGLKKRVEFIAPVVVEAGEHEMIALSKGAERVVLGEEQAQQFEYK